MLEHGLRTQCIGPVDLLEPSEGPSLSLGQNVPNRALAVLTKETNIYCSYLRYTHSPCKASTVLPTSNIANLHISSDMLDQLLAKHTPERPSCPCLPFYSLNLSLVLPPPLPLLVPQHPPQDFSTWRLRNHIDELHSTGQPLMPRLLLLDMSADLPHEHALIVFEADGVGLHDEGFGNFAGAVVLDRDDSTVGDGGVVEQASFELSWCDLKALERNVSTWRKSAGMCLP